LRASSERDAGQKVCSGLFQAGSAATSRRNAQRHPPDPLFQVAFAVQPTPSFIAATDKMCLPDATFILAGDRRHPTGVNDPTFVNSASTQPNKGGHP
jgi:hypothetical protein